VGLLTINELGGLGTRTQPTDPYQGCKVPGHGLLRYVGCSYSTKATTDDGCPVWEVMSQRPGVSQADCLRLAGELNDERLRQLEAMTPPTRLKELDQLIADEDDALKRTELQYERSKIIRQQRERALDLAKAAVSEGTAGQEPEPAEPADDEPEVSPRLAAERDRMNAMREDARIRLAERRAERRAARAAQAAPPPQVIAAAPALAPAPGLSENKLLWAIAGFGVAWILLRR
jgi:hypothetical protein